MVRRLALGCGRKDEKTDVPSMHDECGVDSYWQRLSRWAGRAGRKSDSSKRQRAEFCNERKNEAEGAASEHELSRSLRGRAGPRETQRAVPVIVLTERLPDSMRRLVAI